MEAQCVTTNESIAKLRRELEDENEKIKCLEKSETIDSLRDDIDRLNRGKSILYYNDKMMCIILLVYWRNGRHGVKKAVTTFAENIIC